MFVVTLSDLLALAVIVVLLSWWGFVSISTWVFQLRCNHDSGVVETQDCNAVCRRCGKNLGFIGAWRKNVK